MSVVYIYAKCAKEYNCTFPIIEIFVRSFILQSYKKCSLRVAIDFRVVILTVDGISHE